MSKQTICIDFDGVIHLYKSPWKSYDVIEDGPHPDAFRVLEEYLHDFEVCIYSARSKTELGILAMQKWFRDRGMEETVLAQLVFPKEKPAAVIYLDDRGWLFTGTFPTIDEIKAFKPWNR